MAWNGLSIDTDFTVDNSGNIRYVGAPHGTATAANYYRVIDFHRWIQDLADNASAAVSSAGSLDYLDITDKTPSDRSTDNIITLLNGFNIDQVAAEHLYDGSIIQGGGTDIWDGIVVIANKGMKLDVQQNGNVLANDFWNTQPSGQTYLGLNRDDANGISHKFMIKTRTGGVDIDGRRLFGLTRVNTNTYSEFKINGTSRGNNVMALTYASDLNNTTAASTLAGYTTVTNAVQGYNAMDVDNNAANEYYYSKWTKASYSINQFYERMKWVTRSATVEDSGTGTGTDVFIGNGTITAQGQSFTVGANQIFPTKVRVKLKKILAPTGTAVAKIYSHTGTFGSTGTPSTLVATSDTLDVTKITTTYDYYKFQFTTPNANPQTQILTAATNYFMVIEYSGGNGTNYLAIDSSAASSHAGNRASYAPSTWTASATTDLWFEVYGSTPMYNMPGEMFRGITHEISLTGSVTGTFTAAETITWAGGSGKLIAGSVLSGATGGTAKFWIQLLTGVAPGTTVTLTGASSSATVSTHGSTAALERTISTPYCGVSTGSALIGSFGFGVLAGDLAATDKVFDLTNTQINPPDNRTFAVTGLGVNDYVLVGPENAGALRLDQFLLNTALTTDNITSVVIKAGSEGSGTIPNDTPNTGYIRVADNNGNYRRLHYSARSGSTFTIDTTDGNEDFLAVAASANNNVFISYLDQVAGTSSINYSAVYSSPRALFVRVRFGGTFGSSFSDAIKTFESPASFPGSSAAVRTADA